MGKSAKSEVTDYYMSIHYGISVSIDSIHGIYVREKTAWEGEVSTLTPIAIDAPDLFGGNLKEGGVQGTAYFLPGRDDQVLPGTLASRLGRTNATAPGYRGVSSVFFCGASGGFMWSSNNPYLGDIWMKVRRSAKGLGDAGSQMTGATMIAATQRNSVTINGVTATVTQGVATTINDALVKLDRKSLTINGTEIIVDLDSLFVSVGGVSKPITSSTKAVTVNGVSVTINGSYLVSLGAGTIKVANFRAAFTAPIDANAVHIIYECMTNPDWGMGGAPSSFDLPNWIAAAQTIYNEGFGLSLTWTNQSTVESFVGEIIDHIQATVFINPRNGLWTIKLIRDDYDIASLPVLNRDNCQVTSFDRKGWGETTNEIVVTWTNPQSEQEETVIAQDLANVTIQGAVISDSRNYYGIRNADLAMQVAKRDLRTASAPLAIFEIEVSRDAWDFAPGSVVVLDYPEPDYDIEQLVLRITKIDYGRPGDPTIKINAMEDIFSLPVAAYGLPPSTEWVAPVELPRPMDFTKIITVPLYFATAALNAVDLSAIEFPEVVTMVLAAQDSVDTFSFNLISNVTQPNGGVAAQSVGTLSVIGHGTLSASLAAAAQSQINFTDVIGNLPPAVNLFAFIGDGTEASMEIALLSAYDSGTGWTLVRGLLDTVPRAWPADTPVWFVGLENSVYDETVRAGGETVTYKVLPRTSLGMLSPADASNVTATLTNRPWLPNRPGNVKVGGVAFGMIDIADAPSVNVTWANRNRLLEPTQVVRWTDANITPESGQTTRITVMRADRSIITVHDTLPGTSFTVPQASFGGVGLAIVRVTAVRDGLESLQGHEITVSLTARGYGNNYGNFYGG